MKRSGVSGKWWLAVALACAAVALWIRLCHRGSADDVVPTPARERAPVADARAIDAPARATDAAPTPEPGEVAYRLIRLSRDGKHALLEGGELLRIRVVAVDTGGVVADLDVVGFPPADKKSVPGLLARIRAALRGFPLGACGNAFATTPDGTAGVYVDDMPRFARGDTLGAQLDERGESPLVLPDGKTFVIRVERGDGVGLAWGTLDSTVLHPIDDTVDADDWAATATALRVIVKDGGMHCLVEIPFAPPLAVARKRCFDSGDRDPVLSPTGAWVAWRTDSNILHAMSLATGDSYDLGGHTAVITDSGRVYVDREDDIDEIDPITHVAKRHTFEESLAECVARGEHELVCENRGSVVLVKL